jgi:membrane-associated phospholipid phosphatase
VQDNQNSPFLAPFHLFGESSPLNLLGRTFVLQTVSLAMYAAGHAFDEPDLRAAGFGCTASNVSTTLSRGAISLLLGRQRPREGGGPYVLEPLAFGDWSMRSFFGGHAANIMSCASFWNHRFDLGAAGPAVYAAAGLVGGARVVDEAHWLSDTILGLAYGFAIGKGVAARSRARSPEAQIMEAAGVTVGWQIRF